MSLTLALQSALTGLNVNQRVMSTISNNIANANTEGYSRQVVDLASINIDGRGQGVRVEDVVRKVDEFLQEAIYSQLSEVGRSSIVNEYYERAQILLGEPGSQNSIDEHISTFFNDLQALADAPERSSSRAAVVEAAVNLSREIANLAEGFERLRLAADLEVSQSIDFINDTLVDLHATNEAIANAEAFGTSKAALLDRRDGALRDLSEYMDVRSYQLEDGRVHVYVGNGLSILDDSLYQLDYNKAGSLQTLIEGDTLNPINIRQVDEDGDIIGRNIELTTAAESREVEKNFFTGKLYGLMEIRDELMPDMLDQLDMLAFTLRENFNELHNQGSGYPAADELSGTRLVQASERSVWDGELRIAVLGEDGRPAPSAYTDETSGFRPLTLDFSDITSGFGYSDVSTQSIIDEINNHFGIQQNRFEIGNFNNVELSIVSNNYPGPTPQLEFDFDIENISGTAGEFWVNQVTVLDDTGADITNVTDTMPAVSLDAANTFTMTIGSPTVVATTVGQHGFNVGDVVRLVDPGGGPYNGIPSAELSGYVTITAVTGNTFSFDVATAATGAAPVALAAQTVRPPYAEIAAGDQARTQQFGIINANLIGNASSAYYDITVNIAVREPDGTISGNDVTYRVASPGFNSRSDRVGAMRVNPLQDGVVHIPNSTQGYVRAMLVDENGNELSKVNGSYGDQQGYLKIVSLNEDYTIAIDELDSSQRGQLNDLPPRPGTDRGFSYYYELNNFFTSNEPTRTGDTIRNSALNLAVESRLRTNPTLMSTGNLERSNQPADPDADPLYTYERYSGDQSMAQALAELGVGVRSFSAAGGLPDTNLTFGDYAGEMLGFMSARAISADVKLQNDEILLDGYMERSDSISGVNLDEELANTIIYQNAYTASARALTVTDELFDALLGAF